VSQLSGHISLVNAGLKLAPYAVGLSIGWVNSIRQGVVRQITNISRIMS